MSTVHAKEKFPAREINGNRSPGDFWEFSAMWISVDSQHRVFVGISVDSQPLYCCAFLAHGFFRIHPSWISGILSSWELWVTQFRGFLGNLNRGFFGIHSPMISGERIARNARAENPHKSSWGCWKNPKIRGAEN